MNLRLPEIEADIASLTGCIRDVEDTSLGFESEAGTYAEKPVIDPLAV